MSEVQPELNIAHAGEIYCGIMNTVSDRLEAISEALTEVESNPGHPNNWRNAEFAYLQVRKCIEYIALALLAVHRANGYECEKLEIAYKADAVFNDLAKLNRHGFPKAVQLEPAEIVGEPHHVGERPTLSKRRMKRIYDDCAIHLHSGRLEDIINQNIQPYDLPRVAAWRDELALMLHQHAVMLPDVGLVMIVWLKEPESTGAKVVFVQAQGPFKIEGDAEVYNDPAC